MFKRGKAHFFCCKKTPLQSYVKPYFIFLQKVADFFCLKNIQSIMLGLKEPFLR